METPVFDILRKANDNLEKGISFVLATVVVGAEKTPGRSGFKLISYADGKFEGTVGGGRLELKVLVKCREIHKFKENAFLEFMLTEDENGIGMKCGGEVKVFFEYFEAKKKVFIFGAGHLGRSIVPILNSINFYTIVIDNRSDFADKERIPEANEIIATDYLKYISDFDPGENDAIIIFTHGHKYDYEILENICKRNLQVKYIGMIGSKVKVRDAVKKIKAKKFTGNLVEKIYAPIGLNISKTTPQEISIAIVAEILVVFNDVREISFMKDLK